MYKAIKDGKIIAISETDSLFFCLVKDSVENDSEHTVQDYEQYKGAYLLKSEVPEDEKNKAKVLELKSYLSQTDYIACKLIEALDDTELQDLKEKYADVLKKRREARAEINKLEKK